MSLPFGTLWGLVVSEWNAKSTGGLHFQQDASQNVRHLYLEGDSRAMEN
jgi:hypothetical protein